MSSLQIANAGFRNVSNIAGVHSDLNVTDLKATNINANFIAPAQSITINGVTFRRFTAVGYTPIEFSTAAINSTYSLMNAPNLPAASAASDPNLLNIPVGILMESAAAIQNGTPVASGAATFNIGTAALNTPASNILSGMPGVLWNTLTGGQVAAQPALFGSSGNNTYTPSTGINITVTNLGAAVTAGNGRVELVYYT